jgi:hypothetical protein
LGGFRQVLAVFVGAFADAALRKEIPDAVARLESIQTVDLIELLTQVRAFAPKASSGECHHD